MFRSLDLQCLEEAHLCWDKLADHGVSQSGPPVSELMAFLAERCQAINATWAGAVRLSDRGGEDPLGGWRVGAVAVLHPAGPEPRANDAHFREILRHWDKREMDASFLLPLRGVGTFRSYSFQRDLPPEWFDSAFYWRHYGSIGLRDAVFIAFPLNADCESHFGFYADRPFSDAEIALLCYVIRGVKWFHRHLMLDRGLLVAQSPLTPTERQILQLMLTSASEKEIAHRLNLTPSTAHQYIVQIYRKFSVRSRAGLMSLWLSRTS